MPKLTSILPAHLSPRNVARHIPSFIIKQASHAPLPIQQKIISLILETTFKQPILEGDLDFLVGKWLKIEITDLNIQRFFSCAPKNTSTKINGGSINSTDCETNDKKALVKKHGHYDVCIRGPLKSFALLASQKEDPDTLFFQRKLVIEGDTDLGLEIKNLLDALDLDTLPPELLFAIRSGTEYMTIFT